MAKLNLEKAKAAGFRPVTITEFLGLTPEDNAIIEVRLALSNAIKKRRLEAKQTQQDFAKKLKTSQSRLAKMEAGDSSVALDLLIKGLIADGASAADIGAALTSK